MRWHPRKASLRRKREQADDAQGRKRFGGRSSAICIALFASWYFLGMNPVSSSIGVRMTTAGWRACFDHLFPCLNER